ncbi:hypothetical protein AB0I86_30490 [Streptomyces sp. NPDC049950]|uniref:hypothetical protein n=1 Tax=Streptomyces TaxID=1883 RepID=UPI0012FED71E|nr:hypothetical protein [[Kitasatospora] papulosa]
MLEQTARAGTTTTWTAIRKRLPALMNLHRDDESVLLWLVNDDRDQSEPLLSDLVTVGDRQMHPRFPTIAEQLGVSAGRSSTQERSTWNYEVLKAHQHWRHRRRCQARTNRVGTWLHGKRRPRRCVGGGDESDRNALKSAQ